MAEESIPAVVLSLVEATNNADDEAFVALFTSDAHIEDGGRVFSGHEGAASWNATDNIGVGMHFELLAATPAGAGAYDVTLQAASRRFSGTGTLQIAVRDGLISSLVIV
jgi:hypothetical protein